MSLSIDEEIVSRGNFSMNNINYSRIKIAGLGISGMYLYRRLKDAGFDVAAYDPKKRGYYIPCGYATNEFKICKYMSKINIEFSGYVLSRADDIIFSGNRFEGRTLKSSGLCTFDKNRLEAAGTEDIQVSPVLSEKDELIIDATGISRAYIGPAAGDIKYKTLEYLTDYSDYKDFYFYFLPGGRGYFWSFPMGKEFHIGVGSLSDGDFSLVRKYKKIKVAARNIRMAPQFDSIGHGNIIGVGEAIGTISPVTGEGIIPSLKSAEILYNCLKTGDTDSIRTRYRQKIKKEFGYYSKLSSLVLNVQRGDIMNPGNILAIKDVKKTINEFGIKLDILPFLSHFLR